MKPTAGIEDDEIDFILEKDEEMDIREHLEEGLLGLDPSKPNQTAREVVHDHHHEHPEPHSTSTTEPFAYDVAPDITANHNDIDGEPPMSQPRPHGWNGTPPRSTTTTVNFQLNLQLDFNLTLATDGGQIVSWPTKENTTSGPGGKPRGPAT